MTVRNAERSDIPRILELLVQVDMVHHLGRPDIFKGPATKYSAGQLEEIIENGETPVFVCVDEKSRGRGVGRTLYNHVREYAGTCGCHNITLNVWECNPGARAFYETLGLKPQKIGMEEVL